MRSYFKKRQSIFIKLIHDQAAFTLDGMEALKAYMAEDTSAAARLTTAEKQADEARRILICELNKTFITPLDREDMQRIAAKTDDVIDFMEGISGRIVSYHISSNPPHMLDIAKELVNAVKEVELMISQLKNVKADKSLIDHCRKISDIEHTVDDLYRTAVGKLFETTDAINIIKLKDIYESLETASDRCLDVADVIEDIVLKYT